MARQRGDRGCGCASIAGQAWSSMGAAVGGGRRSQAGAAGNGAKCDGVVLLCVLSWSIIVCFALCVPDRQVSDARQRA